MMFSEMKKVVLVLLVLVVGGFGGGFKFRLQNPCPDIFQYRYDEQGQLYGVVTIDSPDDVVVRLQVELSVGNKVEVTASLQVFLWQ